MPPFLIILTVLAGLLGSGAITVSDGKAHLHKEVLLHGKSIYKTND